MDISETLAPASDQLDGIDLVTGPRTFTIAGVSRGNVEQPVQIELVEFPRVWRPSKGMRRVLASGWGTDASTWTGHRVTLFYDPDVTFGKERPGGTRIKAMSDLPGGKRLSVPMLIARGKSGTYVVEPLPDQPIVPDLITQPQMRKMQALFSQKGFHDRTDRLDYVTQIVGIEVESSKDLTKDQASTVIDALDALVGPDAPAEEAGAEQ